MIVVFRYGGVDIARWSYGAEWGGRDVFIPRKGEVVLLSGSSDNEDPPFRAVVNGVEWEFQTYGNMGFIRSRPLEAVVEESVFVYIHLKRAHHEEMNLGEPTGYNFPELPKWVLALLNAEDA